jgi:type IV secretory pathway TrbD component
MQTHITTRRRNRVYKSLHKPLTYLGVERTLFYFVCVGAVGAFNLFNSLLAGVAVFIGGFAFGHWVTNTDPAFLRILAKSERYNVRYDPAKQSVPHRPKAQHRIDFAMLTTSDSDFIQRSVQHAGGLVVAKVSSAIDSEPFGISDLRS